VAGRRFAEGTKVPVETTRAELERLLRNYGADAIVMGWEGARSVVGFRMRGRHVQYVVDRPGPGETVVTSYPSGKPRPRNLHIEAIGPSTDAAGVRCCSS
jgi:hypothetical protein